MVSEEIDKLFIPFFVEMRYGLQICFPFLQAFSDIGSRDCCLLRDLVGQKKTGNASSQHK
ncbi:Protein of unknown function [Gryllus bimaculatus]|nr:Protein of unknown function [Gryllus bimaculatus]